MSVESSNKSKKVFIVVNDLITALNFRKDLIKTISKSGHDVFIVAPKKSSFISETVINDFFKAPHLNFIEIRLNRFSINPLSEIIYLAKLYRIFKKFSPDYIFLYTSKSNVWGSIAAYFAGIRKVYCTVTGLGFAFISSSLKASVARFFLNILFRISMRFCNLTFFQNNDDQDYFIANKIISKKKCRLINGSGVNLKEFTPQEKNSASFTFLMIARLLPEKGVKEYLDASMVIKKEFNDVSFVLIGSIEDSSDITIETLNQYSHSVNYLGYQENIQKHIKDSDVFVLPSYREGTSKSILEAMAMGKPIVTTNVPGCKDVVENNINGLLIKEKSVSALTSALKRFIVDKEFLSRAGQMSLKIVSEKYDVKKVNKYFLNEVGLILNSNS